MRFYRWAFTHFLVVVASFTYVERLVAEEPVSNAALIYWQAFSTMPKTSDKLEQKMKQACSEDGFAHPLDQQLAKLCERSQYALRMLRRGAEIRHCDWGIDMRVDGAETLLPHFVKARTLTRLSLARARYHFERDELDKGLDDIVSTLTIARHVSHDGTLIGLLVGYSIEMTAAKVLAAYLPMLDNTSLKSASTRFSALPSMASPSSAIESEELFIDWAIEQIEKNDEGSLLKLCETLATSKQQAEELLLAGGNHQRFIAHLESLRPLYGEGIRLLALPQDDFEQEEQELARRLKENPLSKFVFPSFGSLYQASAARSCHWSLLVAAIDIQANGKQALQSHQDPYGDGPFELITAANSQETAGGSTYRLRSRLKRKNGEVVQLTVGRPAN